MSDRTIAPAPGQFCTRHFSWLCQAGQGRCQTETESIAEESTRIAEETLSAGVESWEMADHQDKETGRG